MPDKPIAFLGDSVAIAIARCRLQPHSTKFSTPTSKGRVVPDRVPSANLAVPSMTVISRSSQGYTPSLKPIGDRASLTKNTPRS